MDNIYILNTKTSLQYHTISAINKYEQAYKNVIKLIKSSNINTLDHPFVISARFYKESAKRLREHLTQMDAKQIEYAKWQTEYIKQIDKKGENTST